MNKILIAAAALLGASILHAQDTLPADTIKRFFDASRAGDVETIKSLVAGSFYNRRKVLLEDNPAYPEFLASHYRDSSIEIAQATTDAVSGTAAVAATIRYPDNKQESVRYILKQDASGAWKIVRQQLR